MNKTYVIAAALIGLLLSSCSSLSLSVFESDFLYPAEITYTDKVQKVGFIDRVGFVPDKRGGFLYSSDEFLSSLAQKVADEGYFQEIVLADSTLAESSKIVKPLSPVEVDALSSDLDADLIVSLEQMENTPAITDGMFLVDSKVAMRLYAPGRTRPLSLMTVRDTLTWVALQDYTYTESAIKSELLEYTSRVASEKLLPHWKTSSRYLFVDGDVSLRDGAVLVHRNDWDEAERIWNEALTHTKAKLKRPLAFNLVVCKEMQGKIEEAVKDLDTMIIDWPNTDPYYVMAQHYKSILQQRLNDKQVLDAQMR